MDELQFESTDEMRRQIDETRNSLTNKVETLTGQVRGRVRNIKETFNIRRQIEHHPLLSFSIAVGLGIAVGRKVGQGMAQPKVRASARDRGWLSDFGSELSELRRVAIGSTIGAVRSVFDSSLPRSFQQPIKHVLDKAVDKISGQSEARHNGNRQSHRTMGSEEQYMETI